MIDIKNKIREICTYHSDDGTSGWLLSESKFTEIFDLIEEKENNNKSDKQKKIIIFAGARSPQWDREANELSEILKREGYSVVGIIPTSWLDSPKIEYLK